METTTSREGNMTSIAPQTMDAETLATIAAYATDLAMIESDGCRLVNLAISEYADGSRRTFGLATTTDGDFEQTYRIISPAPWNAPAWASEFTDWKIEVRTGETWLTLEVE